MFHSQYSPDTRAIELSKACKIPFELNAKPGDKVLIVTDTAMDPIIWQSLFAAGHAHGCEVTVSIMEPLQHHAAEPPATVAEAMKKVDICITVTSTEFHQNDAREEATRLGVKVIIMEQDTVDMLTGPAGHADYASMNQFGPILMSKWTKGRNCHITSKSGSDFTITVGPNREAWVDASKCDKTLQPSHGAGLTSYPGGEVCVSAVGESCNGTIVWDTCAHHPVGLLKEPITLIVEKGLVKEIKGGSEAQQLKDYIKRYGDANTYKFTGEICIGINPAIPNFIGILRNDKKKYGKIHTSIGKWRNMPAKLHIDGITAKPTIEIDGEIIVEDGVIKLPPFDKWAPSSGR